MSKALSKQAYWNSLHRGSGGASRAFERLSDKLPFVRSFGEHLIWKVLLKQYAGEGRGLKAIEIGSAPGNNGLLLHKLYGYEPFGVEYTQEGYLANVENFALHGIDTSHVIHADFFSQTFLAQYAEQFDLVMSLGFIEHFEEPGQVVKKHLGLLKKGGVLLVTIPNLQGMNLRLTEFFNPDLIAIHNLTIMNEERFRALFCFGNLEPLYCGYTGCINFGLFFTKGPIKFLVLSSLKVFQLLLNIFLLSFYRPGKPYNENPSWSPYLVFIGRKV